MQVFGQQARSTPISRRDPRVRMVCLLVLAFVIVALHQWTSIAMAGAVASIVFLISRRFDRNTWRRQAGVNVFFLFLLVFVPLSTPGDPFFTLGPFHWTTEGIRFALRLGIRANTVMLLASALLSDIEPAALAHALGRMGLPQKLVQVLFFCLRYLEALHQEYHRLRNALKLRAFNARANRHSLKALGYLVGMLFVRSIDRSERILQAMRCRAFQGRLYSLYEFTPRMQDAVFACCLLLASAALVAIEWIQ